MDEKIRGIERYVKKTEKELKQLEKADKKRDVFVDLGKKVKKEQKMKKHEEKKEHKKEEPKAKHGMKYSEMAVKEKMASEKGKKK